MAKYEMREVADLNNTGERILKPFLQHQGRLTVEDLAQRIQDRTTHTRADVLGVLDALVEEVATGIAMGYSVKLDGLGTFRGKLDLRKGVRPERVDEEGRRNAQNIVVDDVRFQADKSLVRRVGAHFTPERSAVKRLRQATRYTVEERYALAEAFLREQTYMTVTSYARLTELPPSTARGELRKWSEDPQRQLATQGQGTHKVYVWRTKAEAAGGEP